MKTSVTLLLVAFVFLASMGNGLAQQKPGPHSRAVLAKILASRPEMKSAIPDQHSWRESILESLDLADFRVVWDSSEPSSRQPSEVQRGFGNIVILRLTRSEEISGVDKWCLLIFEIENCKQFRAFKKLSADAKSNEISSNDFADQALRLEFKSLQRASTVVKSGSKITATPRDINYSMIVDSQGWSYSEFRKSIDTIPVGDFNPIKYYEAWHAKIQLPEQENPGFFGLDPARFIWGY